MSTETENRMEEAEEALREICILVQEFDPSDGEGTSPQEIVQYTKNRVEEIIAFGRECVVGVTGNPLDAEDVKTMDAALTAIRESVRLGHERNDEANLLRKQLAEAKRERDVEIEVTNKWSEKWKSERAELHRQLDILRKRLEIDPGGGDRIDALESALALLGVQVETLEHVSPMMNEKQQND